ncbi:chemotaxis protein CheA [Teredinibacter waterburyi]|uniref:chemotaxis protein CheA n=1 Tax=Teredinibacter waterburyi TaxID=1500538 RepID=UPI00165F4182|nr:chemotaxis protein CheA [Teredinibacter waterburyi]
MSIDLSQFHQIFFEESFEGLDVMETALMDLNPEDLDSETINTIFRAAHSIKGGSATFGFTAVAEFTHDLETILDQVRERQRAIDSEDVNRCLLAVDCMREMLSLIQAEQPSETPLSKSLKLQFAEMLSHKSQVSSGSLVSDEHHPSEMTSSEHLQPTKANRNSLHNWNIEFIPNLEMLKSGNDAVRIIRELEGLGRLLKVDCTADLPNLSSLDAERCYLRWHIELETSAARGAIEEIFEWVADDCELYIKQADSLDHWRITFQPENGILRTGNDPVKMFSALQDFGELKVVSNLADLPSLALMDHECCYLKWQLELYSNTVTDADIRDIFEWVEDEAKILVENLTLSDQTDAENLSAVALASSSALNDSNVASVAAHEGQLSALKSDTQSSKQPNKKSATESSSIRVGIDKIDNLINMVGELVITQSMLGQLGGEFDLERLPQLLAGLGQLEQNTRELQESVMRIRMLPISFTFSRFPRMVRDLGQALGKELHLEMHGENTELDKTVMEKIGDPLVHLVRNAIDHGIELPSERLAKGKSAVGTITLNAYHQGGNVVIEISDDGKGLDKDLIVAKAIEKNIITEVEATTLSDEQAFDLIFQPGFSTAQQVSDLSGRGVGMDVVKRNIQALNGAVEITSQPDKGSQITIRLPLTLAILDGQLVRVGNNTYIFPLVSIVESLQCKRELVSKVGNGCDVFKLREDYVPIVALYKTFNLEPDAQDPEKSLLVVVEYDGDKVGVVVDELLAQQQVVIKSLEQNYKRVEGVSGATILGDGTVALILDVSGIVKLSGGEFDSAKAAIQRLPDVNNLTQKLAG